MGNAGGTVQPRSEFMPVRPSPFLEHRLFCRLFRALRFFGGAGEPASQLLYSRYGNNPNQALVGEKMAALEGAEAGLLLSSGMSAITMTILAALPDGGHVVSSRHLYGATRTLLEDELPRRGITTTLIDPENKEDWEGVFDTPDRRPPPGGTYQPDTPGFRPAGSRRDRSRP